MISNNIAQFRIFHWNSNGISNHSLLKQLELLLERNRIHIASLNETFFNDNHNPYFNNYVLHRNDRTESRGGGVALLIHRSLKHTVLPITKTSGIENLSIEVSVNQRRVVITTAYSPRYSNNFINDIISLTPINREFFLLGDLNAKHTSWNCHRNNSAGITLNDLQQVRNFFIHNPDNPTLYPHQRHRRASTVDLVLSNSSLSMQVQTLGYEIPSDHRPIICTVECTSLRTVDLGKHIYKCCNWRLYKEEINRNIRITTNTYHSKLAIDNEIDRFVKLILCARDRATPKRNHSNYTPLPRDILMYLSVRNKFKRKQQRATDSRTALFYEQCTKFLNKIIDKRINSERNRKWSNLLENITPGDKRFWRLSSSLRGKRKNKIPHFEIGNDKLVSDSEKAESLANTFSQSHYLTMNYAHPSESKINNRAEKFKREPPNVNNAEYITESELKNILLQLKSSKSPGFDDVPNILLKNLPEKALKLLVTIFNSCICFNYFPSTFKRAKVVAVLKPNKPKNIPSSYRPISLLSNLGKIFEKCIHSRLNEHVTSNNLLAIEQFGFKKEHSTVHQIKRIQNKITINKRNRKSTGVILLDIEKAFDTVWHNGLVFKLLSMNLPQYLCKIVADFLHNRTFSVSVNCHTSSIKNIPAGLPQGSILSPILYNLYISDFKASNLFDVAYYADDTALIGTSKLTSALLKKMEHSLAVCNKYFSKWKIKINHEKTQTIIFPFNKSPKRIPRRQLNFNGNAIDIQSQVTYLGVIFDHKLLFRQHISAACDKTMKSFRALWPLLNKRSTLNFKNKNLLFKCVIRPIMSYASPVWYKAAKCHIKKMQIIQNKCLKMINKKPWRFSTSELHNETGYELYTEFITRQNINFFNKIRHSPYAIMRDCLELI